MGVRYMKHPIATIVQLTRSRSRTVWPVTFRHITYVKILYVTYTHKVYITLKQF